MSQKIHLIACIGCALAALLTQGCAEGPVKADPAVVSELRSRYVLRSEPEGAVTSVDWRESQQEEQEEVAEQAEPEGQATSDSEVTLVGRIGGMPNPWPDNEAAYPWRVNEATFFLVDPATAAEFAEHAEESGDDHAADCPFCAREAAQKTDSIVAVTFSNESGEPIRIDARELLGVAEGDTVVVRGRLTTLLGGDLLVLKATGLYARQ